jgi:hypothetical protein
VTVLMGRMGLLALGTLFVVLRKYSPISRTLPGLKRELKAFYSSRANVDELAGLRKGVPGRSSAAVIDF